MRKLLSSPPRPKNLTLEPLPAPESTAPGTSAIRPPQLRPLIGSFEICSFCMVAPYSAEFRIKSACATTSTEESTEATSSL
jgi:hypothetical protein